MITIFIMECFDPVFFCFFHEFNNFFFWTNFFAIPSSPAGLVRRGASCASVAHCRDSPAAVMAEEMIQCVGIMTLEDT